MRAGLPHDPAQWIALALSVAAAIGAPRIARPAARRALFVGAAALAASALSMLYVSAYLRGGPRIIDATSYWLEARAMAEGYLSWPLREPAASTMGRFLVRSDGPAGPHAAVIFPPGYPALLALGFLAGAPLAVGPLLAAGLVVVTYDLGERVAGSLGVGSAGAGALGSASIPQIAALLSVACAALRYHTADTMSHGLAALCFAGSMALALRALDAARSAGASARASAGSNARRALGLAALAGLLAGWLVATRPFSSLALAGSLAMLVAIDGKGPRAVEGRLSRGRLAWLGAAFAVAALPGIAILAAHQRAATLAVMTSSQSLYYAVSDGPPGCFRYGFGEGVGCLGEHGDFVSAYVGDRYGAVAALKTTLRRLLMHLVDAGNSEPLALLVPAGAVLGWRSPYARLFVGAIGLQVVAYVPFYFDGNYPGGGARFFADVLPFEHVLMAVAAVEIARRARVTTSARAWLSGSVVALALAGFAVRAGFDHALLREREGGRPMFEPARLAEAGVARGIVLVDTDHGYNLGFNPDADARTEPEVLRFRGDALDRMAWEARGRPDVFRYRREVPAGGGIATVAVEPLRMDEEGAGQHIEGESLWPAVAQERAWALPEYASGTCASGGRWLALHTGSARGGEAQGSVLLSLPAPWLRGTSIAPGIAVSEGATGEVELFVDGIRTRVWAIRAPGASSQGGGITCEMLEREGIAPDARRVELRVLRRSSSSTAVLAVDKIAIERREIH